MIKAIQQGLKADGFEVPITKLCHWFGVVRRSVYSKPSRATPKVDPAFAEPIKALIEEEPSFGYRTVGRQSTRLQQEHRAKDLQTQGLAGSEAGNWPETADRRSSIGRNGS
jgi:hypothetical protein